MRHAERLTSWYLASAEIRVSALPLDDGRWYVFIKTAGTSWSLEVESWHSLLNIIQMLK